MLLIFVEYTRDSKIILVHHTYKLSTFTFNFRGEKSYFWPKLINILKFAKFVVLKDEIDVINVFLGPENIGLNTNFITQAPIIRKLRSIFNPLGGHFVKWLPF